MTTIDKLKSDLSECSVRFALQNIIRKGGGDKLFYFDSKTYTPSTALAGWESFLLNMDCGKVGVVRFYGGPPREGKWYDGTVLSMLCDLVLFDKFGFENSAEGRGAWLSA